MLGEEVFRRGARRLAALGLSFDAWLFHPQLSELRAFAQSTPDLRIVLNHLGGPLGVGSYGVSREESLGDWKREMARLAGCENVFVKLGGFVSPKRSPSAIRLRRTARR